MKLNKEEQYAVSILSNMNNSFRGEEDTEPIMQIDIENLDATKYFTGMLIAFKMHFESLTQEETDLIDFTHVINKLAVQYLMDKKQDKSKA